MGSSIYEVTHKKIVCIWTFSSDLKEFFQIIELTVDITAYLYKIEVRHIEKYVKTNNLVLPEVLTIY